jgi:glycosyltransferase involved in cell wall biosynthesis
LGDRERFVTPDPLVSIIIPSYNCSRYVPLAVESALGQSYSRTEIIVVDDGSTDDTQGRLAPYEDRIVILRQANQGVCLARNAGLARATGDWVVFLDSDDCLHPRALEHLLGHGRGRDLNRVLHGDVIDVDELGNVRNIRGSQSLGGTKDEGLRKLFYGGGLPPAAFVAPCWLIREVGGFDSRLQQGSEDLHLWLRCTTRVPLCHVSQAVLYYRIHGSNMSRNIDACVRQTIESRVSFLEWCDAQNLAVLGGCVTERHVVEHFLKFYIHTRDWEAVGSLLTIACEMHVDSPALRRAVRLRLVPKWIFWLKDRHDACSRRQTRSRGVVPTVGV